MLYELKLKAIEELKLSKFFLTNYELKYIFQVVVIMISNILKKKNYYIFGSNIDKF